MTGSILEQEHGEFQKELELSCDGSNYIWTVKYMSIVGADNACLH